MSRDNTYEKNNNPSAYLLS